MGQKALLPFPKLGKTHATPCNSKSWAFVEGWAWYLIYFPQTNKGTLLHSFCSWGNLSEVTYSSSEISEPVLVSMPILFSTSSLGSCSLWPPGHAQACFAPKMEWSEVVSIKTTWEDGTLLGTCFSSSQIPTWWLPWAGPDVRLSLTMSGALGEHKGCRTEIL